MEHDSSKSSRLQTTGRPLANSAEKEFIARAGAGAEEIRQPGLCQVTTGTVQPPQHMDPTIPSSWLPALQIIPRCGPAPLSHSLGMKTPGGARVFGCPRPTFLPRPGKVSPASHQDPHKTRFECWVVKRGKMSTSLIPIIRANIYRALRHALKGMNSCSPHHKPVRRGFILQMRN